MTWLVENPLPIVLLGLAAEAILAVVLLQTGRGALLLAMAGVAMVTCALVAVEWLVVTDTERVESVLSKAAAALRRNDVRAVLECISPDAADVRRVVEAELSRFEVVEARITSRPKVRVNRLTDPPVATADFFARFRVRSRHGQLADGPRVGRFAVELVGANQHWTVAGYDLAR